MSFEDLTLTPYQDGSTDKKFGKLKITKSNGDVELVKEVKSDISGVQARAASVALIKQWERGEYSDKIFRAS